MKTNPRYIGISLQGTFDPLSGAIRQRIRQETDAKIIVGGALTPFIDFHEMERLFTEEAFDYLVVGPGDEALPDLIEALEHHREPAGIPNVFYRQGNQIRGNDLRPINNLDRLPYPDFSQFDLDLYPTPKRILPLQTSRGCSWGRCAFCSHQSDSFGTYHTFSFNKVVETLEHLKYTYQTSLFAFHDAEIPPGRAKNLSKALLDSGLAREINIYFYARPVERYNDPALLSLMRQAGVSAVHWGLESGSQRVLDLMDKGTKVETISQVLHKSAGQGISNLCFVFFGFPGETFQEAQATVDFLKQHHEDIDNFGYDTFEFNPLAPIGKDPEKWGVTVDADGRYCPPQGGLSPAEAEAFRQKFEKRVFAGDIQVGSEKVKYVPGMNLYRMRYFLLSSYRLLSPADVMGRLERREWEPIYPLVGGELRQRNQQCFWQPINFQESLFIHQFKPPKEKLLNKLEEKLFALADGRLSIAEIICEVCAGEEGAAKEVIKEKAIEFFQDIFAHNWGLAFTRSWRN